MALNASPAGIPLSVHVLTFNSGTTLAKALQSAGPVAEIIVMDGGSNDDTLGIAQRFGARVLPQRDGIEGPITDFAAVRNRALLASTQPWILTLDSDEMLSPALREEIAQIARTSKIPSAFLVSRKYLTEDGEIVDHASSYPDERIYFFHHAAVTRWVRPVRERVELLPGVLLRRLQSPCLAPLPTPEEFRRRNERFIRIEVAGSRNDRWIRWLTRRVFPCVRAMLVASIRLAKIWIWPREGKRLPWEHEKQLFWYQWRLIAETCPAKKKTMPT